MRIPVVAGCRLRLPDVSVATADTAIVSPGAPNAGTALRTPVKGAVRALNANVPLIEKSTYAMSVAVPTFAVTCVVPFSITRPLLPAVSDAITGGTRLVVANV